jgi:hypothetical protein
MFWHIRAIGVNYECNGSVRGYGIWAAIKEIQLMTQPVSIGN